MAIGERIHFFRLKRKMTMKYLGQAVGFPIRSADVRLAQYESGTRSPKADLTAALAQVLDVAPEALKVPDIESNIGLMHTLFALEDIYGVTASEANGSVCLRIDTKKGRNAADLTQMISAWAEQRKKLENGEISAEEYDRWRYYYPKYDTSRFWGRVPSREFSDSMAAAFKDLLNDD